MLPRPYQKIKKQLTLKDENIVKVAVQYGSNPAQFIEFDKRQMLENIIRNLCNYPEWGITEPQNYALQLVDPVFTKYITEINRGHVKDGSILILTNSASKMAHDIKQALLGATNGDKTFCLKSLSTVAKDFTFATEFIKINGLDLITKYIGSDGFTSESLKYLLISLIELMEHGTVPWKNIESTIFKNILLLINEFPTNRKKKGPTVIVLALTILDSIVENCSALPKIENDINIETLLTVLEKSNDYDEVQQNVMALINSLFQVASDRRQRQILNQFQSDKFRNVLEKSVITSKMGNELRYQLYVFQQLMLNCHSNQMMTPIRDNDGSTMKIRELKRVAFDENSKVQIDSLKRSQKSQPKLKNRLGFKNEIIIENSFKRTPPGILPLDCLIYFAKNFMQLYKTIVSDLNCSSNDYEFPLGEASIELVRLLCEVLRVGEPPSELDWKFLPILFSHEQPFYELFSVCIESLNQTWRDMKAAYKDLQKVFLVAREQLIRTFDGVPTNFIEFRRILKTFTYKRISILRNDQLALIDQYESTVTAIVKLKAKLIPDVLKLIRNQRLTFLVEGSIFHQYGKNGQRLKDKFWCARLSINHRTLHYGECDGRMKTAEELNNQILIKEMKNILQGKECKSKGPSKLIFGIDYVDQSLQPCDPLEFVAMDELTQNYWVDGLSALLNLEMRSIQKGNDLDVLLSMEIKIRLLDAKGFIIENDDPKIPDDPEDYNF